MHCLVRDGLPDLLSKLHLSPDHTAPRAAAALFLQSESTRGQLYGHLTPDMFKAQDSDMIQGKGMGVYVSQGHTVNLCSPVLKVMYSCDSENSPENTYRRCIVLHCHHRLLLYRV